MFFKILKRDIDFAIVVYLVVKNLRGRSWRLIKIFIDIFQRTYLHRYHCIFTVNDVLLKLCYVYFCHLISKLIKYINVSVLIINDKFWHVLYLNKLEVLKFLIGKVWFFLQLKVLMFIFVIENNWCFFLNNWTYHSCFIYKTKRERHKTWN